MSNNRGPCLPQTDVMIQAGIDPKTKKPIRLKIDQKQKNDIKRVLRIIDEQDAVNRGTWYNLPCNLSSQELERMLYYYGQLAFFYFNGEFYFMRYALDGSIDFYGRYNTIHPLPIYYGEKDAKGNRELEALLAITKFECQYSVLLEEPSKEIQEKKCVLLHDYSKQRSQMILPRCELNDCIIDAMAECVPYMQTSLLNGTGVKGMRVQDAGTESTVMEANYTFKDAALNQLPNIPIAATVDFQELTSGSISKAEEYMLALQSLDNLRLSTYGIDNGGLFEKKAHTLEAEMAINGGPVGLVLQDATSIRKNFCNIVNSIWDLGIWYEPSENITQTDANADGVVYDRNNGGSQSGVDTGGGNDANNSDVQ